MMSSEQLKRKKKRRLTAPRELIDWFPVIDPDLCNSCLSCYDFCPKEVFAPAKAEEGLRRRPKMMVANPYNCVVLCSKCEYVCATGAISLPEKENFEQYVEYVD